MGGVTMNENLDLTKILEGCPKGTKFYSSVFGEVELEEIKKGYLLPIVLRCLGGDSVCIVADGRLFPSYEGECIIFPSRTQRDWSKFERFWDKPKVEKFDVNTLQPFDRILVRFSGNLNWQIGLFGYKYEKLIYSNGTVYYQCVPYNDETKHLIGTTNDCPDYYKWWEEEL